MDKIRIGITQGDINGVGPEVIAKALNNEELLELFTPVVFGNSDILNDTARRLGLEAFQGVAVQNCSSIEDGRINIVEIEGEPPVQTPGRPSKEAGDFAARSLEAATKAIDEGYIDLLVTAPIDKNSIQSDSFVFPGHTEYLEDRVGIEGMKSLMILASGNLRVALATTHLPIKDVAARITKENIMEKIKAFNQALKMDFGCERPKIAVLGLNPHSGDGGVLGHEEETEIFPAIEESKKNNILAFGPMAADGFFGSGAYLNFDGILAMYHDQGLAPFKALAAGGGINFTAGLNIIRTSPAHGTAYDKAGRGVADATSMREAIYAAIDIARHRDRYLEASENPLPIREIPKREPRHNHSNNKEANQPEEETEE